MCQSFGIIGSSNPSTSGVASANGEEEDGTELLSALFSSFSQPQRHKEAKTTDKITMNIFFIDYLTEFFDVSLLYNIFSCFSRAKPHTPKYLICQVVKINNFLLEKGRKISYVGILPKICLKNRTNC